MALRSVCRPTVRVSTPSINMCPRCNSTIRKSAKVSELFPLPVLPAIPTLSFACMKAETSFRTIGVLGLYLRQICLSSTVPSLGHLDAGGSEGKVLASSCTTLYSTYCVIACALSIDTICFSKLAASSTDSLSESSSGIIYVNTKAAAAGEMLLRATIK